MPSEYVQKYAISRLRTTKQKATVKQLKRPPFEDAKIFAVQCKIRAC